MYVITLSILTTNTNWCTKLLSQKILINQREGEKGEREPVMYLAPYTCTFCYITDLYDDAIAESGVAVHLLDLGMTLVQVQ